MIRAALLFLLAFPTAADILGAGTTWAWHYQIQYAEQVPVEEQSAETRRADWQAAVKGYESATEAAELLRKLNTIDAKIALDPDAWAREYGKQILRRWDYDAWRRRIEKAMVANGEKVPQ